MAEESNTHDAGAEPASTPSAPEGARNPDAVSNAIKRERDAASEARAAAAAAQERVAQLEQEQAEASTAAEQAAKDAAAAQLEAAQVRTAAKAGIPIELADRLRGGTAEELLADAETLKQSFAAQVARQGSPPVDGLDGGARPSINAAQNPSEAFAAQLAAQSVRGA